MGRIWRMFVVLTLCMVISGIMGYQTVLANAQPVIVIIY